MFLTLTFIWHGRQDVKKAHPGPPCGPQPALGMSMSLLYGPQPVRNWAAQ